MVGALVAVGFGVSQRYFGPTSPIVADGGAVASEDGRYIAFSSSSPDVVPGDTNGVSDVFLKEVATDTVTLLSKGRDGAQANGSSVAPSISADGSLVGFTSEATNLGAVTEGSAGSYIADRDSGQVNSVADVVVDEQPDSTPQPAPPAAVPAEVPAATTPDIVITVEDMRVSQDADATRDVVVPVLLSAPAGEAISVSFSVDFSVDGSDGRGTVTGTVTVPAGADTAAILIQIGPASSSGDSTGSTTISITLTGTSAGSIPDPTGTVTVVDPSDGQPAATTPTTTATTTAPTTSTTAPTTAGPTTPNTVDGRQLVWSDEFNGTSLTGGWATCYWWQAEGCTNAAGREKSDYYSSQVSVSGGQLRLKGGYGSNGRLVSGMVSSEPNFNFTYGYVEMRAYTPFASGVWPALWLASSDRVWPPEIDIMESFGSPTGRFAATSHLGPNDDTQSGWITVDPNVAHTYGLLWEPGHWQVTVDGVIVVDVWDSRVPSTDMYLIANLALGADWTGALATPNVEMTVDYMRVYQ